MAGELIYTDEAGAVVGSKVRFNHVMQDNQRVPYHDRNGREIGYQIIKSLRSTTGVHRFKGERVVERVNSNFPTLVRLEGNTNQFYPRAALQVKGVDYDE